MNTMTVKMVPYLKLLYKNLNKADLGGIVRFDARSCYGWLEGDSLPETVWDSYFMKI